MTSQKIKFTYMQTPLKKYTFQNIRIRKWVQQNVEGKVLNLFAGQTLLGVNEVRNDLRENMPAHYHMDALEFVRLWAKDNKELFDTVILDPPYSLRKSMEKYDGAISSPFNMIKNLLPKILSQNGIIITFGYNSTSMGVKRGFTHEHILLMSHGGAINDTIATIERKTKKIRKVSLGLI